MTGNRPLHGTVAWKVSARRLSYDNQLQRGIDALQIVRVARDNSLPGPSSTNDDVGVDDVRSSGSCQHKPDGGRVRSVERK